MELAGLLFCGTNRHVNAEQLHDEATDRNIDVSLATVYNTLHQFTEAGLLREVPVDGACVYFDTNTNEHHHFVVEDSNEIIDVPCSRLHISSLPKPPDGYCLTHVDVVMRIRKI